MTKQEALEWVDTLSEQEAAVVLVFCRVVCALGASKLEALEHARRCVEQDRLAASSPASVHVH